MPRTNPVPFKSLEIGERFEFSDQARYWPMEPGPWVKESARKYHKDTTPFGTSVQAQYHREWAGLSNQVGTVYVEVIRL